MANNPQMSTTTVNAEANAVAPLLNSGYLRVYDGTQPANANTAITLQNLLAELRFGATAAPGASGGVLTFNPITSTLDAAATGNATWFRCLESDGSTVVFDGSVGTSGCDLNLNTVAIQQHAEVDVSSFTFTAKAS